MQSELTGLLSGGRRLVAGLAIAGLLGASLTGAVAAQEETASSGNGGTVNSDANGGAVSVGDSNGGGSTGSTVSTGDSTGGSTGGGIVVGGGEVAVEEGASAEDIIAAVFEALGLEDEDSE